METGEEIRNIRLKKIEELRENGINPYPYKFDRSHFTADIINEFDMLSSNEDMVSIAGRIMSIRGDVKT